MKGGEVALRRLVTRVALDDGLEERQRALGIAGARVRDGQTVGETGRSERLSGHGQVPCDFLGTPQLDQRHHGVTVEILLFRSQLQSSLDQRPGAIGPPELAP